MSEKEKARSVNPCGPFDNAQPIHITCVNVCKISPTKRSDGIIVKIAEYRSSADLKVEASFVAS